MLHNVIKTNSSEEFIWASVAGSAPLKKQSTFDFKVEYFHGRQHNKNWICKLKPGLILSHMDLITRGEIKNTITTKEEFIKFVFFMSGRGRVDYDFIDTRFKRDFSNGLVHHSYTSFSPEIDGAIFVNAGHRLHQLTIHISPAVLLNYFNRQFDIGPFTFRDILKGADQISFFHTARITKQMNTAISHILHCEYSGVMRQLYLESKAMELITYKIDQMMQPETAIRKPPRLSDNDCERIKKAADILTVNLDSPPSLFELAKSVGISHTRLNLDFKRIYGTTVFGYLRQIRLEKAKQLLEEKGLNVSETAYEVGYNSIPSFSKAYSDYFGSTPKGHMKKFD
ncbi:MAG: helix-turn-helix transcriptional regulator [Desulfobulbaceae bacterium]|nr:helix-turn-helix transcriptional regulator [Desulfobulbaceae bacterium]